ncbi:hypothetical protein [Actinomadura violacea]|uniref:Uncharacterized protein n=1 Tax=Actinomadura violacea TaxID=2819934 RepID=A0ABS3RYB1_9ACTN|nr:hypothetical protein [Actinomadura violacea]MBO2461750.1 hypothetical protein [Actinomadura violacea]
MLKATTTSKKDGRPLVILGLSGENVTRLAAGEPIIVDMAEMGLPPMEVAIIYGRTEQVILENLRKDGAILNMQKPES